MLQYMDTWVTPNSHRAESQTYDETGNRKWKAYSFKLIFVTAQHFVLGIQRRTQSIHITHFLLYTCIDIILLCE